jgi:hypothetical protein
MQEVSRLVLLVTEITLIHLDNPNHPSFPLCGEKATRLDESDSIVYFGYSFTCANNTATQRIHRGTLWSTYDGAVHHMRAIETDPKVRVLDMVRGVRI